MTTTVYANRILKYDRLFAIVALKRFHLLAPHLGTKVVSQDLSI